MYWRGKYENYLTLEGHSSAILAYEHHVSSRANGPTRTTFVVVDETFGGSHRVKTGNDVRQLLPSASGGWHSVGGDGEPTILEAEMNVEVSSPSSSSGSELAFSAREHCCTAFSARWVLFCHLCCFMLAAWHVPELRKVSHDRVLTCSGCFLFFLLSALINLQNRLRCSGFKDRESVASLSYLGGVKGDAVAVIAARISISSYLFLSSMEIVALPSTSEMFNHQDASNFDELSMVQSLLFSDTLKVPCLHRNHCFLLL